MQYGLLRVLVGKQVILERPYRLPHDLFRIARDIGNHAVLVNDTCRGIIHFLLVIDDCPVRETPLLIFATISSFLTFPFDKVGFFKLVGKHNNPLAQHYQVYGRLF